MEVFMPTVRSATIAIASTVLAVLLTFPLAKFVIHSRDLLFVGAVIVASRYAGATMGLLVSLASVLLFDWFFDGTPHALDFSVGGFLRAVVFCCVSVLVASLEQHRRYVIGSLEKTNQRLRSALEEIKTLRGILPICAYCKKIRTETGSWVELENYVRKHSRAEFSHGICPGCVREHHADLYEQKPSRG
jgi:K+-sensing histidine kinase KdpD